MPRAKRALSPSERGRLGGLAAAAVVNTTERGRKCQAGLRERFKTDVLIEAMAAGDTLTDAELERRVEAKRRLHYYRMNLRRWDKLPGKAGHAA